MSALEEYRKEKVYLAEVCAAGTLEDLADAAMAEMEAELVALRDRRCEGCGHVRHHAVGKPHAYSLCALGNSYGYDAALPDDFACNRWQPREDGDA